MLLRSLDEDRLEPSLLFGARMGGAGAFTVPEEDESGADGYDAAAPAPGGPGFFAPQRPGVPMQRVSAPTRQRTPTTRHAPPPTMQQPGVGRRTAPPSVAAPTFVAQSAKSGNGSSAALMPPPPPRASARAQQPAEAPFVAKGAAAAVATPASAEFRCVGRDCAWADPLFCRRADPCCARALAPTPRPPEPQTRAASGRRAASAAAGARPMLRRVQSTGDMHLYNMHATLRSPMHAVMEGKMLPDGTQDDGIYRIGASRGLARDPPPWLGAPLTRLRRAWDAQASTRSRSAACAFCATGRSGTSGTLSGRSSTVAEKCSQTRVLACAAASPRCGAPAYARCASAPALTRLRARQNDEGAASTAKDFEGDLGDDFDFMDAGLIEDEHSGDAPPGASFEHNSGTSTSGNAGEERQSALESVFQV